MRDVHIEVLSIAQEFESLPDGRPQLLHELLYFPEFSTFGQKHGKMQREARDLAKKVIDSLSFDEVHRRMIPQETEVKSIVIKVTPAKKSAAWSEPVELELPFLQWAHQEEGVIAYVPALAIEVVAQKADKLEAMLVANLEFTVKRRGLSKSLFDLAMVQRGRTLLVERQPWNARLLSTMGRFRDQYGDKEKNTSPLKEVATLMKPEKMEVAYERAAEVERLVSILTGRRKTSVLMVGPNGVGKTSIIREMVRTEGGSTFAKTPFWQTSGGRLVAGQTGFGMWQKRCRDIIEEVREKPVILYLGNLFELMQVGQSSASTESIASFLRPYMLRGELLVVMECTPAQISAIETTDPKILDAFRQLLVTEPDRKKGRIILEKIAEASANSSRWFGAESLDRVDALHRRYSTYSAYPGRPARFIKALVQENAADPEITLTEVIARFSRETGLPRIILDEQVRFDAEEVRAWFGQRVMAQEPAVDLVVDMLATVKARLSRPRKPLGSFMFIGPTGVGKTELAKTLAEFLYASRERMVRFDMSEYHTPDAAQRLVSSSFTETEGLLTAAVREEPFSVILLDEFEKAAPEVYDLFLQVLGEGRLTDGAGRLADFTNAVVIMTSNLGAGTYGKSDLGFAGNVDRNAEAESHFTEAVKKAVRPEFFNRIDRIVPFRPLSMESVRMIAKRELELVQKRDGFINRNLELKIAPDYLEAVIRAGFDPRYGARPLKRSIEKNLLLPVSDFLNASGRSEGCIRVERGQGMVPEIHLELDRSEDEQRPVDSQRVARDQLKRVAAMRRILHQLMRCPLMSELSSELFRMEQKIQWEKGKARRKAKLGKKAPLETIYTPYDAEVAERVKRIKAVMETSEALHKHALASEENELQSLYGVGVSHPDLDPFGPTQVDAVSDLLVDAYSTYENVGTGATLVFVSDDREWLGRLAKAYVGVMQSHGASVKGGAYWIKPVKELRKMVEIDDEKILHVLPEVLNGDALAGFLNAIPGGLGALALEFSGGEAFLRLRHESGLQMLQATVEQRKLCFVGMTEMQLKDHAMPLGDIERLPDLKRIAVRREFHFENGYRDTRLKDKGPEPFSPELLKILTNRVVSEEAMTLINET